MALLTIKDEKIGPVPVRPVVLLVSLGVNIFFTVRLAVGIFGLESSHQLSTDSLEMVLSDFNPCFEEHFQM